MNELECTYTREAGAMCHVLVNEVAKAQTWVRMQDAILAIQRVRAEEKLHVAEWEHLNNPSPGGSMRKPNASNERRQEPPERKP